MSTHEHDPSETQAVGMGVSSERVGPTGHGETGTVGKRDTSVGPPHPDPAPEQSPGGEDPHPDAPIPPVAGYNSHDPRSKEHPYYTEPQG